MRKGQIVKKAFTLIEIVIVLIITAILVGILFRVYLTTADIAMRVKYQKQLGMSLVTTQTILQNIVDTNTIDYVALSGTTWNTTPWWTKTLPLINADRQKNVLTITASGGLELVTTSWAVVMTAAILSPDVLLTWATFIIAPVTEPTSEKLFSRIYHPGFWFIGTMKNTNYNKINFPFHTFFSFLQR